MAHFNLKNSSLLKRILYIRGGQLFSSVGHIAPLLVVV